MISYFTQSKILFTSLSAVFIIMWFYIAYQVGKGSDKLFKDIVFVHLVPIIFIGIQLIVIIYSKLIDTYIPALFSQLYFISVSNLITNLFSFNSETLVIISFLLMLSVFSLGALKGKLDI